MLQSNTSRSDKKIHYVFIEYCCNCSNHAWNTKHDEAKYTFYFEKRKILSLCSLLSLLVKEDIEREIKGTVVLGNTILEPHLPRIEGGSRSKPQLLMRKIEPQLGAFEIIYRNRVQRA